MPPGDRCSISAPRVASPVLHVVEHRRNLVPPPPFMPFARTPSNSSSELTSSTWVTCAVAADHDDPPGAHVRQYPADLAHVGASSFGLPSQRYPPRPPRSRSRSRCVREHDDGVERQSPPVGPAPALAALADQAGHGQSDLVAPVDLRRQDLVDHALQVPRQLAHGLGDATRRAPWLRGTRSRRAGPRRP